MGSQTPFDRLIRAVDEWARDVGTAVEVVAQIGSGEYEPKSIRWVRSLSPAEFRDHCSRARLVVAHAGMGSVLTAMEFGKPLLLLPRRGALRETRNDHQLATAKWLELKTGIWVAHGEAQIGVLLPKVLSQTKDLPAQDGAALMPLISGLRNFIETT